MCANSHASRRNPWLQHTKRKDRWFITAIDTGCDIPVQSRFTPAPERPQP